MNDEIFILSIRISNISIDFPIILKSQDIPSKMLYWQTNTWHLTQYLNVSLLITWFFWSITFIPINTLCSTFRILEKIAVHWPLVADSTALSTSGTYSLILYEIWSCSVCCWANLSRSDRKINYLSDNYKYYYAKYYASFLIF